MSDNIIEVKNLTKELSGHVLLKDINLNISSGRVYGIIGRNGSGKSILIKSIAGLLLPDKGSIKIMGESLLKGKIPENLGVLFDSVGLLEQYSALDNLKILASIKNIIEEETIKKELAKIGLNPNDRRPVKKYSLGMKQKVCLVQAIMENPKIIMLDEPMNGLDEESIKTIREVILKLKRENKAIIITSHNKEDIDILCDEVYKMDSGVLSKVSCN